MIKTCEISNFQSHKSTFLEFVPGVNIITGASDSGKSAIFRALFWVLNNRPLGNEFNSWFSKDKESVNVGIEFAEGTYISKERKNNKNTYDLNGTQFEALKSDVPEDLKKITNIVDYNIQTQHQPYFLLQDTPGEVARKFNEWVGLDIIDRAFSKINSIVSIAKGKITDYDIEITKLNTKVEELAFLNEIKVIVEKLELLTANQEKSSSEYLRIDGTIKSIETLQGQIEELIYDETLENEKDLILKLISIRTDSQKAISTLDNLLMSISESEETLQAESEWLQIEEEHKKISSLFPLIQEKEKKNAVLFKTLIFLEETTKAETEEELKLERFISQYKSLLSKADVCPICFEPITPTSLKYIEANI